MSRDEKFKQMIKDGVITFVLDLFVNYTMADLFKESLQYEWNNEKFAIKEIRDKEGFITNLKNFDKEFEVFNLKPYDRQKLKEMYNNNDDTLNEELKKYIVGIENVVNCEVENVLSDDNLVNAFLDMNLGEHYTNCLIDLNTYDVYYEV